MCAILYIITNLPTDIMNLHTILDMFSSNFVTSITAAYAHNLWVGVLGVLLGIVGLIGVLYIVAYFILCPIKRDMRLARKNYWIWVAILLVCTTLVIQLWGAMYVQTVTPTDEISVAREMLIFLYGSSVDPDNLPQAGYSYILMTFIKLFVFNGILVATMVGLFDRRISHHREGAIRYSKLTLWALRNRYAVVIGSNEVAASVIKNILQCDKELGANSSLNRHCEHHHKYILLQTKRRAEDVRRMLESHLNDDEIDRIIIYTASRDSMSELSKLHLEYASEIYILGEQTIIGETETHHDAMNMRCLNLVAKILLNYKQSLPANKTYEPKVCRVMFEYQTTHSVFQFSDISQTVHETLDFIPFNRYESWARKVLVDHCTMDHEQHIKYTPLDGYEGIHADSDKYVHLVIVGMSKMGVALGIQALFQAHYPNYVHQPNLRTRVTFIDSNADKEMAFFKGRYATLFELIRSRYLDTTKSTDTGWIDPMEHTSCKWKHLSATGNNFLDVEVEFVKGEIESEGVRQYLQEITSPSIPSKLSIAICLTHTHQAIAASLYMPIQVYTCSQLQQILVYQREAADAIYNISEESMYNSVRYAKLRPFGMLYANYMDDMTLFWKAVLTNAIYGFDSLPNKLINRSDPNVQLILKAWHKLPECKKISNKLFADSMYQKIRCMLNLSKEHAIGGYHNTLFKDPQLLQQIATAIEQNTHLAECEHNRWNVEQLLMGFAPILQEDDRDLQILVSSKQDPKSLIKQLKMSTVKVHPNICDYAHLDLIDPYSKGYDKKLNNAILTILRIVDGEGL